MDEFERENEINELNNTEKSDQLGELDDTAVEQATETDDFASFDSNEQFLLSDEPEEKKTGFPIIGIIAIAIAVIIALACFLVVRHNRNKASSEAAPTSAVEETVTAEIRDGKLYINDKEVDPEDIGIDPEDEKKLEEYASSVNKGDVTVANKVVEKYNIAPTKPSSGTVTTSAKSSGTTQTTNDGQVVKPNGVLITSPVAREFEVGYSGKVTYSLLPLGQVSSSQRGVEITSSDPSVIYVDHLGDFVTKKIGTATITVKSKVAPKAASSITLKVVDQTTTLKIKVPTVATTAKPTVPTTSAPITTTKPTTAHNPSGPVYIDSMSVQGSSGVDGSSSRIISIGGSTVIGLNFSPSNATKADVTFSSSNPSVCTVTSDGRVVGVGKGTATIVISPKKGSASNCIVNITVS